MRITADIIDEESHLVPKELSFFNINSAPSYQSYHLPLQNVVNHTQTVQEVTQKFQNLNLYDIDPAASQQICNSSKATFHTMVLLLNNLPDGCTFTELKTLFSQYGTVKQIDIMGTRGFVEMSSPEEAETALKSLNKFVLQGSTLSVRAFGSSDPKMGSPPSWFQHHMSKMKQEIKKELIEELLAVSCESRQVQADILNDKANIVVKEDSHIQCQGEVVHNGIFCDNCDQLIHGIRYKCGNCSDFDLCQECETLSNVHNKDHIFLKIRYPNALKLYQKQKWQELMSPVSIKPTRYSDAPSSKVQKKKLYEAKFLCDETVPDGSIIAPSTRFVKSWKVLNNGVRVWTHATKLRLTQGPADLIPSSEQIDVPHLKPGEEGVISILFTSPSIPGVYRSHWNFCHKNRPFGQMVWCHISVKPVLEELRSELPVSSGVNKLTVNVSNIAQVLTAVKEEHEDDNMVPRKLVVNSHTATPNNTPFALTPPKSPDHETLTKSMCGITSDKTFLSHCNDSDNDDECSIVSFNSTDSETEFVVIPMPKCFNLSESFISNHLQLPHNLIEADVSSTNEVKENMCDSPDKPLLSSGTVSQETGVPELSENVYKVTIVENMQKTQVCQVATDGSSSEISIIESDNNSPTVENASEMFDTYNVKIVTESDSNLADIEKVTARLVDVASSMAENKEVVSQQPVSDILSSATFPKFPVEGVTGDIYERLPLNPNTPEESRTIQVLPEGLVFGALNAAASVYNTAKAVISTIQQPKENVEGLAQPLPRSTLRDQQDYLVGNRQETLISMEQLVEMGFCNRQQNETLLQKHKGDVALVVAELVNLNDNDWYASRHNPPSPRGFLD